MAKLTDAMKAVITGQQAWVATSGTDGRPNLALKGTAKILDDEHIAYFELYGNRTWANVQRNPWVAIGVADSTKFKGYRFEGKAEIVTSGPLYDEAVKFGELLKLPAPPKAAIKVKIEEIYNIGRGGMKVD
ncbi:MAG: pyridoxamine 5'-phosphate oxidase family protein [Chloroflexi bacterium]|nr:pyridoxamine 5'-phosphate oxidase family protein [Chloroflexota bacterium]